MPVVWRNISELSIWSLSSPTRNALETIPKLPHLYDEPFADSSQIPTAFALGPGEELMSLWRISGDGGDEACSAATTGTRAERFWRRIEPVPRPVRSTRRRPPSMRFRPHGGIGVRAAAGRFSPALFECGCRDEDPQRSPLFFRLRT